MAWMERDYKYHSKVSMEDKMAAGALGALRVMGEIAPIEEHGAHMFPANIHELYKVSQI